MRDKSREPEPPGYDSRWIGENPPPVYAAYMKGINWLKQNLEWVRK